MWRPPRGSTENWHRTDFFLDNSRLFPQPVDRDTGALMMMPMSQQAPPLVIALLVLGLTASAPVSPVSAAELPQMTAADDAPAPRDEAPTPLDTEIVEAGADDSETSRESLECGRSAGARPKARPSRSEGARPSPFIDSLLRPPRN